MKVPDLPELKRKFNLTPLQARFIQELPAQDWNAAAAAEAAGYSASNAKQQGCRNLAKDKIQLALSAYTEALAQKAELRVEDLVEEYRRLAFSSIGDVISWSATGRVTVRPSDELPREVLAAVKKVKWRERTDEDGNLTRTLEVEMHSKGRAMDKLGQYLGLWNDPNEIRVRILQIFAEMSPEELARLETMPDEEILELIEENGVWRLPGDVGS